MQERDITVQLGFVVITLCTTHCYISTVMFTYSAKHNHNLFNILCRKSAGESDTAYTMGADTGECTIEEVLWRKAIGCKYTHDAFILCLWVTKCVMCYDTG